MIKNSEKLQVANIVSLSKQQLNWQIFCAFKLVRQIGETIVHFRIDLAWYLHYSRWRPNMDAEKHIFAYNSKVWTVRAYKYIVDWYKCVCSAHFESKIKSLWQTVLEIYTYSSNHNNANSCVHFRYSSGSVSIEVPGCPDCLFIHFLPWFILFSYIPHCWCSAVEAVVGKTINIT